MQDRGRHGHYHVGIPPSGALDLLSALAANLLVGNPDEAAVLEATFNGPRLRFDQPAVVAVTGGLLRPRVNGEDRALWESFAVDAGDVLEFDTLEGGARTYIAISGGVATEPKLGSRSTYALGALRPRRAAAAGRRRPAPGRRARQIWPSSRSAPAATRPTSSTRPTRSARSRCRAARSRSCCTAMRCPVAAI